MCTDPRPQLATAIARGSACSSGDPVQPIKQNSTNSIAIFGVAIALQTTTSCNDHEWE